MKAGEILKAIVATGYERFSILDGTICRITEDLTYKPETGFMYYDTLTLMRISELGDRKVLQKAEFHPNQEVEEAKIAWTNCFDVNGSAVGIYGCLLSKITQNEKSSIS